MRHRVLSIVIAVVMGLGPFTGPATVAAQDSPPRVAVIAPGQYSLSKAKAVAAQLGGRLYRLQLRESWKGETVGVLYVGGILRREEAGRMRQIFQGGGRGVFVLGAGAIGRNVWIDSLGVSVVSEADRLKGESYAAKELPAAALLADLMPKGRLHHPSPIKVSFMPLTEPLGEGTWNGTTTSVRVPVLNGEALLMPEARTGDPDAFFEDTNIDQADNMEATRRLLSWLLGVQ